MTTATKYIKATATAPTSRGSFSGRIRYNMSEGDTDNERIRTWRNLPANRLPVTYMHTYGDPIAASIGHASATPVGDDESMLISAKLDIHGNSVARSVHERLLLPSADAASLHELSVGFAFDPTRCWVDANNVRVIEGATLLEVAVVAAGAQESQIFDAKAAKTDVDGSAWDGNRAMSECITASDYREICAGERSEGDTDERQHWALPHHYLGKGPNAAGVRNALARIGQTQGLKNAQAAQDHLDAHMRQISGGKQRGTDPELARYIDQLDALEYGAKKTEPDLVEQFIAEDRAVRRREREEAQRLADAVARTALPPGVLIPSAEEDRQRDAETFARTLAEITRRDEQRAREFEQREEADAVTRQDGFEGVFYG